MPVTHLFVSVAPPSPDPAKVGSVEWNAGHVVDIANADVNVAAGIAESKLALNFPTHASVSLDVNADTVLSLVGQALGLDTQIANRVFAGPAAGVPAVPTFRALVASDIPALPYGDISGTGVVGQVAEFVTNTKTIQAAKIIGPAANILTLTNAAASTLALNITAAKTLTLTAADDYNLTVPATGTAALLATANVFTTQQMVDGTSNQIQLRVQGHSTQTTNLQTWEDSAGNVVGYVSGGGRANWNLGTSADNTFIGSGAGRIGNTGTNNIGIGFATLAALTNGNTNLCIGANAGKKITSGGGNVCIGNQAGAELATAANSVFIGSGSGASATGGANTGIGAGTFTSLLDGVANFALGLNSGYYLTSGDYNIFIGARSGARHTTEDQRLVIDSQSAMRATVALEISNAIIYGVMASTPNTQTLRINALQSIVLPTTTTNAVLNVFDLQAYVSTASTGFANGGGVGMTWTAETATDGTSQLMAAVYATWIDATNASRKAKLSLSAYDTVARLGMEIEASGSAPMLSFYGGTTVVRGAALTPQLTTITFTAPGAPDYAVQDFVDVSLGAGWAFANHDEANSVLSVIANLQTRVAELEARLGSATGVNLFA